MVPSGRRGKKGLRKRPASYFSGVKFLRFFVLGEIPFLRPRKGKRGRQQKVEDYKKPEEKALSVEEILANDSERESFEEEALSVEEILANDSERESSEEALVAEAAYTKTIIPKLDKTKLIIEELAMGNNPDGSKAKLGSEVTVSCVFKAEDSRFLIHERHSLVLGNTEEIKSLHEGLYGMRIGDKRRLLIPPSLRHEDRAICDVKLVKLDH